MWRVHSCLQSLSCNLRYFQVKQDIRVGRYIGGMWLGPSAFDWHKWVHTYVVIEMLCWCLVMLYQLDLGEAITKKDLYLFWTSLTSFFKFLYSMCLTYHHHEWHDSKEQVGVRASWRASPGRLQVNSRHWASNPEPLEWGSNTLTPRLLISRTGPIIPTSPLAFQLPDGST